MLESKPGPLQLVHWQSDALTTRLDLIRTRLDLIRTWLDLTLVSPYLYAVYFLRSATLIVKYLSSKRPFFNSFDVYLKQILSVLTEQSVQVLIIIII
jgi:hypothetical protein